MNDFPGRRTICSVSCLQKHTCSSFYVFANPTRFRLSLYPQSTPCFLSLSQENLLRQRLSVMEDDDKQQAPPPPPRTSFERTITVVRGNRSLGMFSVFLVVVVVVVVSWCVYVAGVVLMPDDTR